MYLKGTASAIVYDEDEEKDISYEIEQITATFGEDIHDVIGVVRCTGITIESDAPEDINTEAEEGLYNEFADIEYNDADGDGTYIKEAEKDISDSTGVDISKIVIDFE